jgi:hypothetical protein
LVFDYGYSDIEATHDKHWSEFYPDAKEEIPFNAPKALGKTLTIVCYINSDHAGDTISRRSQTGVLSAQIMVSTDLVKGLRYKLQMIGFPIKGTAYM